MRRMTLRAGKGETVASLARRYKVSASQVAQWNRVSASSRFTRGQTVVVFVSAKKSGGNTSSTRTVARSPAKSTVRVASASRASSHTRSRTAPSRSSRMRVASAR